MRHPAGGSVRMSVRARTYLGIGVLRHGILGLWCLIDPSAFFSPSFAGIRAALPTLSAHESIVSRGVLFVAAAALCLFAAWSGHETAARGALMVSAIASAMWAAGYLAQTTSPVGPTVWLALTCIDLVAIRQPQRNPFEDVIREVLEEESPTGLRS